MQANYQENEITSVLQKVKIFNKNIGAYEMHAINDNFDYVVKLSTGKIVIKVEELQDDAKDALTPERLTAIAARFVASGGSEPTTEKPITNTAPENTIKKQEPKKKSNNGALWAIISSVVLVGALITWYIISHNDTTDTPYSSDNAYASPSNNNEPPPRPKTEAELKEELLQTEIANPLKYINVEYTWRVNLIGNTVLEGKVTNSATMTGFKNVVIRAKFLSKTDVLLGQEEFTVMEFVPANGTATFKYKIDGWWKDATTSQAEILGAEPY